MVYLYLLIRSLILDGELPADLGGGRMCNNVRPLMNRNSDNSSAVRSQFAGVVVERFFCQRYLSCCQPAFNVAENLRRFPVRSVQAREMTFN